jgi:hypothetical protein
MRSSAASADSTRALNGTTHSAVLVGPPSVSAIARSNDDRSEASGVNVAARNA